MPTIRINTSSGSDGKNSYSRDELLHKLKLLSDDNIRLKMMIADLVSALEPEAGAARAEDAAS